MHRDVVILTKSSKNKGLCVAGIDINNGEWLRLTTNNADTHGALSYKNVEYKDSSKCEILDIVRVQIKSINPSAYQPENVLIDENYYFQKIGVYEQISDVLKLHPVETREYLLGNEYNYITDKKICAVGHSLTLVKVSNLVITHPIKDDGKKRTKAEFLYNGKAYSNMSVTDTKYYDVTEQTKLDNAILVVSLPDAPFPENKYFKFVAQIFNV